MLQWFFTSILEEPRFCQYRDYLRLSWAIVHDWQFKTEKYETGIKSNLKTKGDTPCLKEKIHAESCQNEIIMLK